MIRRVLFVVTGALVAMLSFAIPGLAADGAKNAVSIGNTGIALNTGALVVLGVGILAATVAYGVFVSRGAFLPRGRRVARRSVVQQLGPAAVSGR